MDQTTKRPRRRRPRKKKSQPATIKEVTQPVARSVVVSRTMPMMNGRAGSLTLQHHEVLRTIISTTDKYAVTAVNLVPASCTWLKGVAVNFSKWRWRALNVVYIPACSTTTQGNIDMALQYDGNDTAASSPEQLAVMSCHSGGPLWSGTAGCALVGKPTVRATQKPPEAIATIVDVNRFPKKWYSYYAAALSGDTQTIYCPCDIQFGVTAKVAPAAGAIGYLWISYIVDLIEPIPSELNK